MALAGLVFVACYTAPWGLLLLLAFIPLLR